MASRRQDGSGMGTPEAPATGADGHPVGIGYRVKPPPLHREARQGRPHDDSHVHHQAESDAGGSAFSRGAGWRARRGERRPASSEPRRIPGLHRQRERGSFRKLALDVGEALPRMTAVAALDPVLERLVELLEVLDLDSLIQGVKVGLLEGFERPGAGRPGPRERRSCARGPERKSARGSPAAPGKEKSARAGGTGENSRSGEPRRSASS